MDLLQTRVSSYHEPMTYDRTTKSTLLLDKGLNKGPSMLTSGQTHDFHIGSRALRRSLMKLEDRVMCFHLEYVHICH
jgi:hypothetical protein